MDKQSIAQLSGGAARLLLVLLLEPGLTDRAQLMARAGIDSRPSFFRAKAQLRELGLLESHPATLAVSPTETPESHPVRLSQPVRLPESRPVRLVSPSETPARVPDEGDFLDGITGSWLGMCADADRLPSDGDPTRVSSNYQARRRAQIAALKATWADMFPGSNPLQDAAAKDLLRNAGDSAEAVYEAFEIALARKGTSAPLGYVLGILKRQAAQAAAAPAPVQAPASDDDGLLPPMSEEERQRAIATARYLKAKGWDMTGVIPGEQ